MDKYKFVIELIDIRIRILSNERNFYNDARDITINAQIQELKYLKSILEYEIGSMEEKQWTNHNSLYYQNT